MQSSPLTTNCIKTGAADMLALFTITDQMLSFLLFLFAASTPVFPGCHGRCQDPDICCRVM